MWGNGLSSADSNFAEVSSDGTPASWSHSQSSVTGHRRFHFFAVSQSGRTSFQSSGVSGGSTFQDSGNYARFYDVFVDNQAPVAPSLSTVNAVSTSEIDLGWSIPLDLGVGVGTGSTESAGYSSNAEANNWNRVGYVGCQVYRGGSTISSWGTGTTKSDTGLAANTQYTYTIEARDNATETRGPWHNSTGPQGSITVWTLSTPPGVGSVSADQASPRMGSNVTWTAASGFGPGQVQYYRYAWDSSPTHTWKDTETQWSSGTTAGWRKVA